MSAGAAGDLSRLWRAAAALARAEDAATRIGATPAAPAWSRDHVRLLRVTPTRPPRGAPLLIVHGLIARPWMTDLDPERSLIRRLRDAGTPLYLMDWGDPGRAGLGLAMEDYVEDWLAGAATHVRAETGRAPALLGVCQGGVFAACLAALEPRAAAGLALAITPIDFHAAPEAALAALVRGLGPEALSRLVDALGGLPGPALATLFQTLEPARTAEKYGPELVALGENPRRLAAFLRMERWLGDRPRHPAAAAKQLLVELYAENRLARGRFTLSGRPARLSAVRVPTLCLYGARDRIVPPPSARAAGALVGGPYEEVELPAGHVGVFVSARAREATAEALLGWLDRLPTAPRSRRAAPRRRHPA
jgi:polyhydroxyalkanoate synthase